MARSARRTRKKPIFSGGRAIRLLSLDVDGVLTDGGLYYADDGTVSRKFNVRDGVGIQRILARGIEVAIVSAGTSGSIPHRAKTLGIRHALSGVPDKLAAVEKLCRQIGCTMAEVAHVGDDLNDVALLKAVGWPLSVADAVPEARAVARYVTRRRGGEGAVREICDLLFVASGKKSSIAGSKPPLRSGGRRGGHG